MGTSYEAREKIQKYEFFLNDILKEDLKSILEKRDGLYLQVAEYLELEKILENIVTNVKTGVNRQSMRTLVDLGCNFYAQGEAEDLSKIIVEVGLGVWLPMSPAEAKQFCNDRISFLNKKIDLLTQEQLKLKSKIDLVYSALQELQQL